MKSAEIHTARGVMKVKFYEEDAPNTVANFVTLSQKGFYNGLTFHRVIPDLLFRADARTVTEVVDQDIRSNVN